MGKLYRIESPERLVDSLLSAGKSVLAPVRDGGIHRFLPLNGKEKADFGYFQAKGSVKALFLPRTEAVLQFTAGQKEVKVEEPVLELTETVVIGCRPCDAAALPIQDKVFSMWGRVAWAKKVPPNLAHVLDCGMGMSFVDPTPEWLEYYQSWSKS